MLLSASNKRFIGELLGREIDDRRAESLAAVAYGVLHGCRIVRVHDVRGHRACVPDDRGVARRRSEAVRRDHDLVQGADPVLRDREVQRVVDELLDGDDRSLALDDHTIDRDAGGGAADDDAADDDDDAGDGASSSCRRSPRSSNALQSPPFMTECRVRRRARDRQPHRATKAKWLAEWIADPLDGVHLVLVAGGARTPAALDKACKANAQRRRSGGASRPPTLLRARLKDAGSGSAPDAASRVADAPRRRCGTRARARRAAARRPTATTRRSTSTRSSSTSVSSAPRAASTSRMRSTAATSARALEALHRLLTATSAAQPKPLHPMQVMASLVFHYQRLLRLDDPAIITKEQAAEVLGMKSAGGARFPLEAPRKLGTDGLRDAIGLLAQAELDLRGQSGLDERTVIDVLVARLAALSRRHARGTTRGRPQRV